MSQLWFSVLACLTVAQELPRAVRHVVVYREEGRFAGWPANHGIWSWGDEILVGFSRGYYKDRGPFHHIDKERPEEFNLARSQDGGMTWSLEDPQPLGILAGTAGMRHGTMPPGLAEDQLIELREPIRFDHSNFAMTVRMQNSNKGTSRFFYSYDRGKHWRGPFPLPLFDQKGVMGRTDYVVDGSETCTIFLTASKANGREGRPFCCRTTDGGLTWKFLSFIGPEPDGYAIMPSSARLAPRELVTTIRQQNLPQSWIDAYISHDDGLTWSFLSKPEPDTGEGNPPSLLRLPGNRLCLIYGSRKEPFGIYTRLSSDLGKTWGDAVALRSDAGGRDIGYVRSIVRPDGRVVAVYYYQDRSGPTRYLAATIWNPVRSPITLRSIENSIRKPSVTD